MLSNIVKHFLSDFHTFHSSFFINYLFKDLTLTNCEVNVLSAVSVSRINQENRIKRIFATC